MKEHNGTPELWVLSTATAPSLENATVCLLRVALETALTTGLSNNGLLHRAQMLVHQHSQIPKMTKPKKKGEKLQWADMQDGEEEEVTKEG